MNNIVQKRRQKNTNAAFLQIMIFPRNMTLTLCKIQIMFYVSLSYQRRNVVISFSPYVSSWLSVGFIFEGNFTPAN